MREEEIRRIVRVEIEVALAEYEEKIRMALSETVKIEQKVQSYTATLAEALRANREWRDGRSAHEIVLLDVILNLFGYAGLRLEEALRLQWKDLRIKDQILHVNGRIVTPHPELWEPLTSWRAHVLEISTEPVLLDEQGQRPKRSFETATEAVLVTQYGQPLSRMGVRQRLYHLSEHMGKPISAFALRRQFAALMTAEGMPLEQVQQALGHENPETTRRYLEGFSDEPILAGVPTKLDMNPERTVQ